MAHTLRPELIALALLATVSSASAHPRLTAADPAKEQAVSAAPKVIRLSFNEVLTPKFSQVRLTDSRGNVIPTGTISVDPKNKKTLVVPVSQKLSAGRYQVEWRVVSKDTHRVTGRYSFEIGKAAKTSPPA